MAAQQTASKGHTASTRRAGTGIHAACPLQRNADIQSLSKNFTHGGLKGTPAHAKTAKQ
ncbi:MAG: hypothetical protein Q7J36_10700 [Thiobacillus sp.]|nr:hypothetical protein [Thiobacillus sp.]